MIEILVFDTRTGHSSISLDARHLRAGMEILDIAAGCLDAPERIACGGVFYVSSQFGEDFTTPDYSRRY